MEGRKIVSRKTLLVIAATVLLVLAGSLAIARGGAQSTETYEVTFAGRQLSIPASYFPTAPGHSDKQGVQGMFLRFLWPSLEGKTSRNASAFNDPRMPVNGMHMQHVRGRTERELVAVPWVSRTNDYRPSDIDPFVGGFRFADDVPDRDGHPIDVYYRSDGDGAVSEFIVCDLVGAGGYEFPNPGCRYVFAEDGIRYQTTFRLHLLPEASAMKTAWLATMREFEDKQ